MRKLPTASQLHRAFRCAASEVLPHFQSTSEHAERGTMVHEFIEHARKVGRETALADLPEEYDGYDFCAALPLNLLPAGGSHELALAWDYETDAARALPTTGHRDYQDAKPTDFVGTADYVGRDGGSVVVLDYKTGHKYLGPAHESRQLRMLALAAARMEGIDEAQAGYCFLREDGSYAFSWAKFDAFDLGEIADELRGLADRLGDTNREHLLGELDARDFHEGDWCDYCPAFNSCPAKMQLARAIGTGDALRDLATIERRVEDMTDAEMARAYEAIERYSDVAERVREALRQRAAMQPIDLGDGRRLGAIRWPFTCIKPDVAYETVRELHGEQAAETAVPRKATLGALKKLGDETLAEIERRRGVITGSKLQVRVHRP
jgi:hypothetical protein